MTLSDLIEKARDEITAKGLEEKLVVLDSIAIPLLKVAKIAQLGVQRQAGWIDVEQALAALETALREVIHE